MSQVAKEDKSYSVEDLVPSKEINFGSSKVLFAHQASQGDKSIDLTNLVTPPDMGANGFVQAISSEISAAHLSVLRNNLDLRSTRGPLIPFLDYVVTDAGTINFLPTSVLGVDGALEGEIFVGVIDTKKANSLVVGDVKEYDVTIDDTNFTPGDTVLNLGVKYKVNENSLNQTGEFRAYKNGKRIYRNKGNAAADPLADGNFHEVDAGTGEGTTIELNVPAQAGDIFGFDFGLKISKGDVAIFEALERLQGSFLKLATDAAPALGNPLSNYFTANPSEIERRAFGDILLKLLNLPYYYEEVAILKDVRTGNDGSSPTGAYFNRRLNVLSGDSSFVTFPVDGTSGIDGTNTQFTLAPGDYEIFGASFVYGALNMNCRLRNLTDNNNLLSGNANATTGSNSAGSFIMGKVNLDSPKLLQIQHYTEAGVASFGTGDENQFTSDEEFYAWLVIRKITKTTFRQALGL